MDNIQKSVLAVLGLSVGLTLLVPNAVDVSDGNAATAGPSKASEAAEDRRNSDNEDVEEADDSNEDDDGSSYANDAIPTFGEPIGVGGSNGDPTAGFDTDRKEVSEENNEESENVGPAASSRSFGDNASENPKALSDAGLKNGSGGRIEVSAEDLQNARPF